MIPEQTCPSCSRAWTPTPFDDCFVPACGCFDGMGAIDAGVAPCEACGLSHALRCDKMPERTSRPRAVGDHVKIVEVGGPLGETIRPSLIVRDT